MDPNDQRSPRSGDDRPDLLHASPARPRRGGRLAAAGALALGLVVAVAVAAGARHGGGGSHSAAGGGSRAALAAPGGRRHRGTRALPAPPADLRGAAVRRLPVPILMYHVVTAPHPGTPLPQLWTSRPRFASEMRALARRGFYAVTLARVYDAWRHGTPLPRHPIVVSFDDGYLSQYTNAMPILRSHGWPGVLNLKVKAVDEPGGLSAGQVRRMIAAGWEVDSHTITHPDLTTLPPARLRDEVARSGALLRRRFHIPVDFFCYPSGRYDAAVVDAVRRAGYRAATTVDDGLATPADPLRLKRVRVDGSDDAASLLGKLAGAGDSAARAGG